MDGDKDPSSDMLKIIFRKILNIYSNESETLWIKHKIVCFNNQLPSNDCDLDFIFFSIEMDIWDLSLQDPREIRFSL